MITTLVVVGLVVLTSISFLAGITYTDYARDQANRLQAAERRELNAMIQQVQLLRSYSCTAYNYMSPQSGLTIKGSRRVSARGVAATDEERERYEVHKQAILHSLYSDQADDAEQGRGAA